MKPLLYYTVKRERWSRVFVVMRVTSEGSRNRINGSIEDFATHTTRDCIFGKFDNEEAAGRAALALHALWETFEPALKTAKAEVSKIELARETAIDKMLASIIAPVVETQYASV
jgi:hypothetical protein